MNQSVKPSAAAAEHWLQVPGCSADLSTRYCQLKRVCEAHMKATSIQRDGSDKLWRFCQQCGKLEPMSAFEGGKRSCRRQLAKRREACARQQQASTGTQSQRLKQPQPSSFALFEASAPLAASHTPSAPLPALQAPDQVAPMLQQQQQWAAAGAAANSLLDQQLQMYSERCAMLRMQIDMLEAEACKHELLDTDVTAPAGGLLSSASPAQHNNSTPADAGVVTYTPVFSPTTGEGSCWGSGFVSPAGSTIPAENGMGSCTSTAYGGSNTAPLPGMFAESSRSSSIVHHGLFSAGGSLTGPSDPGLAFACLQQQQQQQQAYAAGTAAAGPGAIKLEPWSCIRSEPVNACGFLPAGFHELHAFSSGSWACAQQQQMMQPPVHVEQMLVAGGASAPLPACWGPNTGLPAGAAAAPCGPQSGGSVLPVFIDRRAGPGAVGGVSADACGHPQAPLMVLTEGDDDTGVDIMDCDSAEDIEGAQEDLVPAPACFLDSCTLHACRICGWPARSLLPCFP